MTPSESSTAFAAACGVAVESSSVREGLERMFSFFSRAEIASFRAFVLSSAPYAAVQGIAPAGVDLEHSYV